MNLSIIPNILTGVRIILIAPFLLFLYQQAYTCAFYTFFISGLTDGLDGWLARHFHWQTSFGSMIDPIADKLLIAVSFISLAFIGQLPWWLVMLVFLRDLTISLGVIAWYWWIQKRLEFSPTYISKFNTALQLLLVTICLFELAFFHFPQYFVTILIITTAITTLASYFDYVWTWGKKACSITRPHQ